jgi:serine/threonine protein kinase
VNAKQSMSENDKNKSTLFIDEFNFSLSDEERAINSTINPKIQSNLTSFLHEKEVPFLNSSGKNFAGIELRESIGEGGMGIVYCAQEFFPYREVAIKRLKTTEPKLVRGLLDEAMVMGKLSHPNIPPVYQLRMNENEQPEVIMKKIEGKTFQDILGGQPQKGINLRSALHVLIQVCHAVECAHSFGFLHRDLKPENIMVGKFNQVYLMDWGLAVDMNNPHRSRQGLAGTPAYMAPEMLEGKPSILTPATDIYLLGTILHEILVGKYRHQGDSVKESLQSVRESVPYEFEEDAPSPLVDLCNRSCAKEVLERPQGVVEFRESLEDFFEHWDALKLVENGDRNFRQYKRLWKEEKRNVDINYPLLLQLSQQAKFSYEQALSIWSGSTQAQKNLMELLELMIEQALYANEFHRAVVLFKDYPIENLELTERLAEAEKVWISQQKRQYKLDKIEKELDPNLTLAPRFILQRILFVSVTFVLCFLGWWQYLGDFRLDLKQIFYSIVIASIPIWLSIAILYRRLMVNSFGRQAVRTILYGTIAMVFSRYSALVFGAQIYHVVILDSIIIALGLINSAPAIKNGSRLGIFCFFLVGLSITFPEYSQIIFNFIVVFVCGVIAFQWRKTKFLPLSEEGDENSSEEGRGLGAKDL